MIIALIVCVVIALSAVVWMLHNIDSSLVELKWTIVNAPEMMVRRLIMEFWHFKIDSSADAQYYLDFYKKHKMPNLMAQAEFYQNNPIDKKDRLYNAALDFKDG